MRLLTLSLFLLAGACAQDQPRLAGSAPPPEAGIPPEWRNVATPEDQDRIDRIEAAWAKGLSEARARAARTLGEEGPLVDPGAVLPRATLTPGRYECRVVRLGRRPGAPAFARFPPYFCYVEVEGALLTLVKETGSSRPAGRLWLDRDDRLVFLGTTATANEQTSRASYGGGGPRDVAGVVERIGPMRWRLVMPFPRDGGAIEIVELTPYVAPRAGA